MQLPPRHFGLAQVFGWSPQTRAAAAAGLAGLAIGGQVRRGVASPAGCAY